MHKQKKSEITFLVQLVGYRAHPIHPIRSIPASPADVMTIVLVLSNAFRPHFFGLKLRDCRLFTRHTNPLLQACFRRQRLSPLYKRAKTTPSYPPLQPLIEAQECIYILLHNKKPNKQNRTANNSLSTTIIEKSSSFDNQLTQTYE